MQNKCERFLGLRACAVVYYVFDSDLDSPSYNFLVFLFLPQLFKF